MAKQKKEVEAVEEEKGGQTPQDVAFTYLKQNKEEHFNFQKNTEFKISTGSLTWDLISDGGIDGGAITRFLGVNNGGKTSEALEVVRNFFLQEGADNNYAVYFKCEGRLNKNLIERSGVTMCYLRDGKEKWLPKSCLIIESNIFEFIFGFIANLVKNNPNKSKYVFIVDSLDGLCLRGDMVKKLDESLKVAGPQLMTKTFLKQMGLQLHKNDHTCILISQITASPTIGYQSGPLRQFTSSGGNAVTHWAESIYDFQQRNEKELIRESAEKNSKIIGHWAKVMIRKSANEKNMNGFLYPICYGRKGGNSIWKEYEIFNAMVKYSWLKKEGAWFSVAPERVQEFKDNKFEIPIPERFHGQSAVIEFLEENKTVVDYIFDKIKKVLCKEDYLEEINFEEEIEKE